MLEVGEDVLETVLKAFNKTKEELDADVTTLKEWMKTQRHLPESMDEKKIRNLLIFNKCKLEKTKFKIDMYYTMRSQMGHIFKNSNPQLATMKRVTETMYFLPLPKLVDDLYRVFVMKVRRGELMGDLEPYESLAHIINVQEIRIKEDVAAGDIFILDSQDVCFRYYLKLTPRTLYHFLQVHEKLFSSRLKAVYMINTSIYMEKLVAVVKLFMKRKLFGRIHVSRDASILKTEISEEVLPKEYGGKGRSLEDLKDIQATKFNEYQKRFDELDTLRVNESLRCENIEKWKTWGLPFYFKKSD